MLDSRSAEQADSPTDVVGPLQFDGDVFVSAIIRLDGLNYSNGCNVLKENNRTSHGEVGRVIEDRREDEHPRGSNPDI